MKVVASKLTERCLPAKAATFANVEAWLGLLALLADLISAFLDIFSQFAGGGSE